MIRILARIALALAVVSSLPLTARAQTRRETVRGRVTSDSGVAIKGAVVSVTMAPDRTFRQDSTSATGTWSVTFDAGTGDYLVHVAAVGYKAERRRITRQGSDTSVVADFRLAPVVAQLAAVNTQARKLVPDRRGDDGADVGSANQAREGVFASLRPDQEGNLAAIANAIPGANAQPDGLSVFGLAGSQSNTTLNGMAFGGTSLPRDGRASISVATSPYDPSRGGFSGGQTNVELSPGNTLFLRRAHLTVDPTPLQYTDAVSRRLGQRELSMDGSFGSSGPLLKERYLYNAALQLTRRSSDAASFLTADDEILGIAGVAPDSADRLRSLLAAAHVPLSTGAVPGSIVSDKAAFSLRFDRSPYKPGTFINAPVAWNASFVGNLGRDEALSSSPLSVPTRGGSRRTAAFTGIAVYSRYFGDILNDTRVAANLNAVRGTPYLRIPGGSVLVSSSLPNADGALSSVDFGGNSSLDYRRTSWNVEAINETQLYARGKPHRVKLTLESRLDDYDNTTPDNLLGQFSFPSLSALAAGQPSSFSRTLTSPSRTGGEWSGFAALGDYWRVTRSFQLLYGARIEANHYTTSLASNPTVAAAFGESTSEAPNRIHVSPRVGFSWYFGKAPGGKGFRFSQFAQQSLFPDIMLRGGFGEFRSLLSPSLLSDVSAANGLPGSATHVTCFGTAVPTPNWENYLTDSGTIPSSCAGGAPSAFTDAAPTIRLLDRNYDAARSWRGNLSFIKAIGAVSLLMDGVLSFNVDQPGTYDVNFAGTPRFTLTGEGGRPVFVNPSSIVASTGAVSPVDARTNASFGRVVRYQSDLRSTSRQLTTTIAPSQFNNWVYSVSYTLGDMRADARGFDGATFGAPTAIERAPGNLDVRHQWQASIGRSLPHNVNLSLFGRLMSGAPYTPLVAGDINGDGLANDRAFVFEPAHTADPALAKAMSTLLLTAPDGAAECLASQLGQAAARNGCRGPWTAWVNARMGVYSRFGWTKRGFNAVLNFSNVLAGLDQVVHGADDLRGWGGSAYPDPFLLTPRGFDPSSSQFRYEVNPRFGSTRSSRMLARAPFRVSIDLNFDLGVPQVKQQAIRLLSPGRAGDTRPRMSVDSIASKLRGQVADVYDEILEESDSLLLSREQTDSLKVAQKTYLAKSNAHWTAVATKLADMGDRYDADAAMFIVDDAIEQGWLIARDEFPTIKRILSPLQIALAPWKVHTLEQAQGKKSVGVRTPRY
ncbi:MAG: carboxypeptidase-like regulatory domain-containing protein [Gemmatimonadaceae bacterium]